MNFLYLLKYITILFLIFMFSLFIKCIKQKKSDAEASLLDMLFSLA